MEEKFNDRNKDIKPCKFCNEYFNADDMLGTDNLITGFFDFGLLGDFKVAVNIESDSELTVHLLDNFYTKAHFSTHIKYCPMCGRKLDMNHSEVG